MRQSGILLSAHCTESKGLNGACGHPTGIRLKDDVRAGAGGGDNLCVAGRTVCTTEAGLMWQ